MCPCSGSSASGAGGNVWARATRPRARARRRPVTWMTCRWWAWLEEGQGGARGQEADNQAPPLAWLWLSTVGLGPGTELAGMQVDKGMQESETGIRELTPTLYPEALTCSPLLVRVDFMRMKKERSWTLEGGPTVGLASGAESGGRLWGPEEKHTGHPCPLQS